MHEDSPMKIDLPKENYVSKRKLSLVPVTLILIASITFALTGISSGAWSVNSGPKKQHCTAAEMRLPKSVVHKTAAGGVFVTVTTWHCQVSTVISSEQGSAGTGPGWVSVTMLLGKKFHSESESTVVNALVKYGYMTRAQAMSFYQSIDQPYVKGRS